MSEGIWFRPGLMRLLKSKELAARRDKSGERLEGYLEALFDLGVVFGTQLPRDFDCWWLAGDGNLVGDGNEMPIEAR